MLGVYRFFRLFFILCLAAAAACILLAGGYLAAVCAAGAAVWMLRRRITIPHFTLVLLLGGFLLRVIVIAVLRPPIISDFSLMYTAAQELLSGDASFKHNMYFSLWAYQSVFVAWQAMWLAIWNNPLILKLVNALLSTGIVCLLYRMARGYVRECAAQAMALLLTVFPFALTLHTVLTNQIASAFFLTLGLWLISCRDCERLGIWRFVLACVSIQAGNLLRSEGIIIVVAALAYAVFAALRHPQQTRRILCGSAALLVLYTALGAGASTAVRASGLNENGTANAYPAWKFITGLNFDTKGAYSTKDWNRLTPTFDENYRPTDETRAIQEELLSERLSAGPKVLLLHIVQKTQFLWCDDALHWAFGHLTLTKSLTILYQNIQTMDRLLFFGALLLSVFGLVARARHRTLTPACYLPLFVVFAAFCAFLLIEVQPRYAYLPQLFLFCGASLGLDQLIGKGEEHA